MLDLSWSFGLAKVTAAVNPLIVKSQKSFSVFFYVCNNAEASQMGLRLISTSEGGKHDMFCYIGFMLTAGLSQSAKFSDLISDQMFVVFDRPLY